MRTLLNVLACALSVMLAFASAVSASPAGSQADHIKVVRQGTHYVQRLPPDRACGTKYRDALYLVTHIFYILQQKPGCS